MSEPDYKILGALKEKYPTSFKGVRVLELGSRNINGTVRDTFEDCDFVGVDYEAGKDVDVVAYFHDTKFKEEEFDTLVSFNAFEHDPWLDKSVSNNLPFLKKGGMIFFRFGAPGSAAHGLDYEPGEEGKYRPKEPDEVASVLEKYGCKVIFKGEDHTRGSGRMGIVIGQKI